MEGYPSYKILKVKAEKCKVIVGSGGGKILLNSVSGPVVSVGKQCKQTLLSVQHVKNGFTSDMEVGVVNWRWESIGSGVSAVMVQPKKQ